MASNGSGDTDVLLDRFDAAEREAVAHPNIHHSNNNIQGHPRIRFRMLPEEMQDEATTKVGITIIALVHLPQILATLCVLHKHWSSGATCDRPLREWVIFSALRQISFVVVSFAIYFGQFGNSEFLSTNPSRFRVLYHNAGHILVKCKYGIEMIGLAWFVIGNTWVFASTNCEVKDPAIYHLALALIFINYAMIFLPCAVLVLLIPIGCLCLPCILRFASRMHARPRRFGATVDVIDKLESVKYSEGMYDVQEAMCCICLCDYEVDEDLRVLPCKHHFHTKCADEWLQMNGSCPNCRKLIADDLGEHQSSDRRPTSSRSPHAYELITTVDTSTVRSEQSRDIQIV